MTIFYVKESVPLSTLNSTINALCKMTKNRTESFLLFLEYFTAGSPLFGIMSEFSTIEIQYLCMNTIVIIDEDCIYSNFTPAISNTCFIIYKVTITNDKLYNRFKLTELSSFLEFIDKRFDMESFLPHIDGHESSIAIDDSDNHYTFIKNLSVGIVP